jgi:hypothetical protein
MDLTYIIIAVILLIAIGLVYQISKPDTFYPYRGGGKRNWLWLFIPLFVGLLY